MTKYDVIIIGAGSAGLGNSGVANALGLKTLLIEKDENNFGGDCTNFGCVPSKALIHIANQFHAAKKAEVFGLSVSGKADMKKVLSKIHSFQDFIKESEDAEALRSQGIEVVIGEASFDDKKTISVGSEKYTARCILLCTGSSPRWIDIDGAADINMYTNENIFFDCKVLPTNFIVIGGGPIGCELGQAFSRLGSKVTIVNHGERILANERASVSQILQDQFEKEDIQVYNNATVKNFKNGKASIVIGDKQKLEIPCDSALLSIGRIVNTKGLSLEKAGIELTDRGKIKVNQYLKSTNPNVYVLGDAAGEYMFSHGAEKMVRQLWRNLLIPILKKKNTTEDLSWVTFTEPQVAHFGLTEKEMDDKKISYYRQDQSFGHDDRAIVDEYQYGQMSIWFDKKYRLGKSKILSGSMIAPAAGELMQELQLAQHAQIPIEKLNNRVYPYPVASRINQKTIGGLMKETRSKWKINLARTVFRLFHHF